MKIIVFLEESIIKIISKEWEDNEGKLTKMLLLFLMINKIKE